MHSSSTLKKNLFLKTQISAGGALKKPPSCVSGKWHMKGIQGFMPFGSYSCEYLILFLEISVGPFLCERWNNSLEIDGIKLVHAFGLFIMNSVKIQRMLRSICSTLHSAHGHARSFNR